MAMAAGKRDGAIGDVNVTPLIDVLLVLIIIFMVITPLTPQGLNALVPQPAKSPGDRRDSSVIVVSIDAERQVRINQERVDIRGLGWRLEDIFKTRNERVVFVKADPSLPFGDVAHLIDVAKGAGIDRIGLLPKSLAEE